MKILRPVELALLKVSCLYIRGAKWMWSFTISKYHASILEEQNWMWSFTISKYLASMIRGAKFLEKKGKEKG